MYAALGRADTLAVTVGCCGLSVVKAFPSNVGQLTGSEDSKVCLQNLAQSPHKLVRAGDAAHSLTRPQAPFLYAPHPTSAV